MRGRERTTGLPAEAGRAGRPRCVARIAASVGRRRTVVVRLRGSLTAGRGGVYPVGGWAQPAVGRVPPAQTPCAEAGADLRVGVAAGAVAGRACHRNLVTGQLL